MAQKILEKSDKDLKLSNIKGVLIFLVVFGHVMELYKSEFNELYVFIYSFHMPMFIIISGYFAKRVNFKKIINFVLLYIIFQTIFTFVYYLMDRAQGFDVPIYHLWYIVSMIFWYLIVLLISKIRMRTVGKIFIFLLLASLAFISRWYSNDIELIIREYYPDFYTYTFSYQRTITFLPFFMLGYFIEVRHMKRIYNLLKPNLNMVLFIITAFLTFYYANRYPDIESVFRGSLGSEYFVSENNFSEYMVRVFIHYILATWITFLLLNLVHDKENIFTKWGDNSLTIFLFHPIFVFTLWQFEFFLDWNIATKLMFFLCLTIFICTILGSNLFFKTSKPICQPYFFIENIFNKSKH